MTPKEKSIELVYKFMPIVECGDNRYSDKVQKQNAKQCALIAVDEIMKSRPSLPIEAFGGSINLGECTKLSIIFWQQVKTEIEKL